MLVIKWKCSIRDFRWKFHLRYIAFVAGVEREKDREKGEKGGPIEWLGARRNGWSGGKGRREEGESGEGEGERERERCVPSLHYSQFSAFSCLPLNFRRRFTCHLLHIVIAFFIF